MLLLVFVAWRRRPLFCLYRKRVVATGDSTHAWCVSFKRLRDPPYFVIMYLVSP